MDHARLSRRGFLAGAAATALWSAASGVRGDGSLKRARIAITLDLEMSRHYPRRGMLEWDYQKGNLDEPTKHYAVQAARIVKERGGVIHFFCVGRVLEQENVDWLKGIAEAGHPVGNHTYDHVNLLAATPRETQFRFQRSPWLVAGKSVPEILRENILLTNAALNERLGLRANGFRTPGGFANGLAGRPDLQQMLLDLGFNWGSSKYPAHNAGEPKQEPTEAVFASIVAAQKEAQPFVYPSGLVEVPMSPISDVNAFRTNFWKREWFLEAIRRSVTWAIEAGGVFDFLAHPSCLVVEDPEFESIKLICDLVRRAGDRAAIVGLDQIAKGTRTN